jgi:hypothetical protein
MSNSIPEESLVKSVGNKMKNTKGKPLGKIVELIPNDRDQPVRYLVLQTSILFGLSDRFFAIPASPQLLEVSENGKIILKISKDDLVFARTTRRKNFPQSFSKTEQPIFEIYGYEREVNS